MHDLFWYLLVPFGWELTILGLLMMLSTLVHRWQRLRRERQEINQRLAETIKRAHEEAIEKSRALETWRCWRCGNFFDSERQPRPVQLCNGCLEQYQKVVA